MGEVEFAPDVVFDHGAHEEDGPGTWECLEPPRTKERNDGDPIETLRRTARRRTRVLSAQKKRSHSR